MPITDIADSTRASLVRWLFTPLAGVPFDDWRQLLARRGHRIAPRYWPRAAFTTAMSLLNSALVRQERRYDRAIEEGQVEAPLFILGHHRSGTTHLWNLLATDERFSTPTVLQSVFPRTFLSFESSVQSWAERFSPSERPQDNMSFSPDAPMEDERALCAMTFLSLQMARHFPQDRDRFKKYLTMRDATAAERARWKRAYDRFAHKLSLRYGPDSTLLLKGTHHAARIPLLLDLYPDARFVHIHRNPYRVFQSTVRMEEDTMPLYAYQPLPDRPALEAFVLWRYRTLYDAFFEDRDLIPEGQFTEIRFETLVGDRVGTIERVYDDLGLPGFESTRPALERYVASIADYETNTYPDLPPETRRRVVEAWRPCFERWAYPVGTTEVCPDGPPSEAQP